jgi:uncharacterized protein YcbK (DUF882 family)
MGYFSINELVRSKTAIDAGINNTPSPEALDKLLELTNNVLEVMRTLHGAPIIVNSGYRSPALNKLVGGAKNSAHLTGEAADITTGSKGRNKLLFAQCVQWMAEGKLVLDQLIDEKDYLWLHVSYRADGNNRGQVLHLS